MPRRWLAPLAFMPLLAGLSGPVLAVSVNNMVAWSDAGKPLRMDIELVDLQAARPSDISLRVASASDHSRLGINRPDWADSVRFQVLSLPGGRVVARATSSQPVSGEAVSFLVEIRALGGGTLQQVAARLDSGAQPIADADARPAQQAGGYVPSERARPKPAPKPVAKPKPAPVSVPEPVVEAAPAPAPAPRPVVKAATPAPAAAPAPVAAAPAEAMAVDVPADAAVSATDVVAGNDSLEAVEQERAVLQQQLQDVQAQAADIEARLKTLDEQLATLKGEPLPVAEEAVAEEPAAEPDAAAAAPDDGSDSGLKPYDIFARFMLLIVALILIGSGVLGHLRDKRRK